MLFLICGEFNTHINGLTQKIGSMDYAVHTLSLRTLKLDKV